MDEFKGLGENIRLQMLNAIAPHLELKYYKKLAVAVKLLEIREICGHCDGAEKSAAKNPIWKQNVISAALPYLSEQRRQSLKTLVQIMEMKEVIDNIENFKELFGWK